MRRFLNFSRDNNIEFNRRDDIVPGVRLGKFNATVRQRKNTGDFDVFIYFNKYGLRDTRDISKAKESSFLIVGDSFTFGWGIKRGKRFSDLLFLNYDKDVYNVAIPSDLSGYKSLIKYAEKLGAKSKNIVLVICMENDLLMFNDEKLLNISKKNKGHKFKHFLTKNSAIYYFITSVLHQNDWSKHFLTKVGLIKPNIKTSVFLKRDLDGSASFIKNITNKFNAFIVLIPSRYNWAGNQERIAKYRNEHTIFKKKLEKSGLNVLDLREKFEDISKKPLLDFHFAHDGHWNYSGQSVAAEEISKFISE